jgi:glutamate-1-semialdehyde 2,1-aminomutase
VSYSYTNSQALFERAKSVIPNGVYGHFNPVTLVPSGTYPNFAASAKGARFTDVDGNEFIDYMCAFGPMILGYANPVVDEAYQTQMKQADTCTLASPVMVDLAEYMVDLIPMADWAFFAKNGADATSLAVMIARAATGRKKIIAITDGYHGTAPWMLAKGRAGLIEGDHANVIRIPWNDLPALETALDANASDVAAFIASPYHHPAFKDNAMPAEGYWAGVHALLKRHGVVSISDDVRAGFRIDMGGSHEHFGYTPDLVCYCKAIANGYPISALVGTDALKEAASSVFHTGSFWFSAGPMAAALACLKELKRIDAPTVINDIGTKVFDGLTDIAKTHGHELRVTGMPSMPYMRIIHEDGPTFHQKLCGECAQRGLFLTSHHNLFVSAAHTEKDIQQTWDIFNDALTALK